MGNVSKVIPSIHPAIGLDSFPAVPHMADFAALLVHRFSCSARWWDPIGPLLRDKQHRLLSMAAALADFTASLARLAAAKG